MNVGLSNLHTLKTWLLPSALAASTDHDGVIQIIGETVAAQIEAYTARKFARLVGATYIGPANREVIVLDRLPVEEVSLVEYRETSGEAWTATSAMRHFNPFSGVVFLADRYCELTGQLRVTYTGGYWWPIVEPADADPDNPETQPETATALPAQLRGAWLVQCKHAWDQMDKLKLAVAKEPNAATPSGGPELLPQVREVLNTFRRFSL